MRSKFDISGNEIKLHSLVYFTLYGVDGFLLGVVTEFSTLACAIRYDATIPQNKYSDLTKETLLNLPKSEEFNRVVSPTNIILK